jgi:hypothetical protein
MRRIVKRAGVSANEREWMRTAYRRGRIFQISTTTQSCFLSQRDPRIQPGVLTPGMRNTTTRPEGAEENLLCMVC